jgi:hypothetical protein
MDINSVAVRCYKIILNFLNCWLFLGLERIYFEHPNDGENMIHDISYDLVEDRIDDMGRKGPNAVWSRVRFNGKW